MTNPAGFERYAGEIEALDAKLVVEREPGDLSARLGRPSVTVCDRYLEVAHHAEHVPPDEAIKLVRWLEMRCEECPQSGVDMAARRDCGPRMRLMRCLLASRIMARTTLDLDPSVLRELRRRGEREGKSMGRVASEVLARALADGEPAQRPALAWISDDLGAPRADLEDKEAVRAILDGDS